MTGTSGMDESGRLVVTAKSDRPICVREDRAMSHNATIFPTGYLPFDCPACGRRRLEYGTNDAGGVTYVACEKCGANSKDDTFPSSRAWREGAEAWARGEDRNPWLNTGSQLSAAWSDGWDFAHKVARQARSDL